MSTDFIVAVPDLGDFKSVDVIDVLVKVGDAIEADTPLVTLETEKATMDVPSTAAGRVAQILVSRGDKVASGTPLVRLAAASVASDVAPAAAEPAKMTASSDSAASVDVAVPELGDFKSVDVVDVLVKVGDEVDTNTALATLETEKATMDVPSTVAGRVLEIRISRGDKVSAGSVVVRIAPRAVVSGVADIPSPAATRPVTVATPAALPAVAVSPATRTVERNAFDVPAATRSVLEAGKTPIEDVGFSRAYAGPSVRLLARELGVDLGRVTGTGVKGRITHEDVKGWVKQALSGALAGSAGSGLPKIVQVDHAKFGQIRVEPLSRIQKISGPRLHASWVNIPHVTQYDEADITDLEAVRATLKGKTEAQGVKLTPLAFIIRACVQVLKKHPRFNASLDATGENLVFKEYLHIGFAADTPNGLVVPVLRDADRKDVYEIARDLAALSEKARSGKLTAADMQGGCFTISSLGGIGGTAFTPIINAPEVAILGVSKSSMKPVWNGAAFMPRLMLPLSLSYDHRVIDGASAARFTADLSRALENVSGLIEAVP